MQCVLRVLEDVPNLLCSKNNPDLNSSSLKLSSSKHQLRHVLFFSACPFVWLCFSVTEHLWQRVMLPFFLSKKSFLQLEQVNRLNLFSIAIFNTTDSLLSSRKFDIYCPQAERYALPVQNFLALSHLINSSGCKFFTSIGSFISSVTELALEGCASNEMEEQYRP